MSVIVQTATTISIITERGTYVDTLDNFVLDSGGQSLPRTVDNSTRQYEQDVRHCFTDGKNIIAGGPVPWDEGDAVIADIVQLLKAQADRQPPPPELKPAKKKRTSDHGS